MIKKETNFLRILLVFTFIFSISFVSSAANLDDLHLNIQTTDGSGKVITGTFNFEFKRLVKLQEVHMLFVPSMLI